MLNTTDLTPADGTIEDAYLRFHTITNVIFSIAYCSIAVVGIVGNSAVYIVVRKSPQMRSLTNQLIANLAVADLLVNILCVPFTLVSNLNPEWTLGTFMCKAVSYTQGVSVSASVNTLVAISIERCVTISYPYVLITLRQHRFAVMIIWGFALAINLPWLFVFQLKPLDNSNRKICTDLWPSRLLENIYFLLVNMFLFYLGPLCVISFCYILIWMNVTHRNIPGEYLGYRSSRNAINKSRLKVTKMMFVVIITFALFWLPLYSIFCIVKFWEEILHDDYVNGIVRLLVPVAQWLGSSNSSINPILYCYMDRKFRICFKNLVRSCSFRFGDGDSSSGRALIGARQTFRPCIQLTARLPVRRTITQHIDMVSPPLVRAVTWPRDHSAARPSCRKPIGRAISAECS